MTSNTIIKTRNGSTHRWPRGTCLPVPAQGPQQSRAGSQTNPFQPGRGRILPEPPPPRGYGDEAATKIWLSVFSQWSSNVSWVPAIDKPLPGQHDTPTHGARSHDGEVPGTSRPNTSLKQRAGEASATV